MKKLLFLIILIINFYSTAYGSIKEKILYNFEKINNLSFNFKQTIDGKTEAGNCIIKYPKKIYCSYNSKNKRILVSNGKAVVIKSKMSNQYFLYPIEKTQLNIILDKRYLINEIKKLQGRSINDKYYNFSLENKNNVVNIFFDKKTYNLIGWQMEDIYQNLVVTYIFDLEINKSIKEKIFLLPQRN